MCKKIIYILIKTFLYFLLCRHFRGIPKLLYFFELAPANVGGNG